MERKSYEEMTALELAQEYFHCRYGLEEGWGEWAEECEEELPKIIEELKKRG